jgi:DNA-directed RNA polymerase subunit alpha
MNQEDLSGKINVNKISEKDNAGIFEIEKLYPGYGLTIGNSLRRALLSSIPGAAVTQFKVKGILHEFSVIPGVLEDVLEIGLNLKKVRFNFYADEPQTLTLKVKGEKKISAGDIAGNAQLKIINPDQHLFTITEKKVDLEMQITVERGLGYVPVEKRKKEKLEIGVVALDAVFSPVRKVSFSIESMRVGDRTDYNKLLVALETDGSISPAEALAKATDILSEHFRKIYSFLEKGKEE